MIHYFTEEDVGALLTMDDAIEAVEGAFGLLAEKKAENRPRARVRAGKLVLHVLSAGSASLGYVGVKAYTTGPAGARFYFLQFDAGDGRLVAMMEADRLGQIRTGAASGVATKYMALEDASRVGIYGSGWQARSQLEAVSLVRPLDAVFVYSPRAERREAFCREMSDALGVDVTPCDIPERVPQEADIVITATNAREPVLEGKWLRAGQHVNAIGSNHLRRIEIDADAVTRSHFIATDSVEQAKIECGDLASVVESGGLAWSDVHELDQVVSAKVSARQSDEDITLFESQGLAIEDVAVAKRVYELGMERGVGKKLDL